MNAPEAKPAREGRIKLDWVSPEQDEATVKSLELEAGRQELLREQHQDWIKIQTRNLDNQERSHEAWIQMNERAVAAWERMATALEAMNPESC